jgi:hypothetical protein
LVFGVLTPILPANAAPSPVSSPAPFQNAAAAKAAPKNNRAPAISGTTRVPNQLSVTNGTWSGAPMSYTYQWFRCAKAVKKASTKLASGCSTIGSATASTYTLTDADAGKQVIARVSGTNASGTVSMHSASKGAIIPRVIAPKNTVAATISGTAQVSRVLAASNGTWIESPTEFGYQWYQCSKAVKKASSSLTKGCKLIGNQTDSTYQLTSNDARKFVLARVSASNNAGSASVFTSTAGSVAIPSSYAPSVFAAPAMEFSEVDSEEEANAISGSPTLGSVLVASKGQWLGFPLPEVTYSYWYRCDSPHSTAPATRPSDCYAIPGSNGANAETYLVETDDVGKHLAFEVIATNSSGTTRYFTPTTDVVNATPTLLNSPVLSGSPRYGQNLSVTNGRWSIAPSLSMRYGYQWYRCDSASPSISDGRPENCSLISGQTTSSYRIATADLGKFVFASVVATNSLDESAIASAGSLGISDATPQLFSTPMISGMHLVGDVRTLSELDYIAYPDATVSVQWLRCTEAVANATDTVPETCSAIVGETGQSYTLAEVDLDQFITAGTTITNTLGTLTTISKSTVAGGSIPSIAVSTGDMTSCVVWLLDKVSCFGDNHFGQLGDGTKIDRLLPVTVLGIDRPIAVSTGRFHSCALNDSGQVVCWGDNQRKQLGVTNVSGSLSPVEVDLPADAVEIDSGDLTTCAILSDKSVSCWGDGMMPWTVQGIGLSELLSISESTNCTINSAGDVYCWDSSGHVSQINLGFGPAISLSTGLYFSCAVGASGDVICWGSGSPGNLAGGNAISVAVGDEYFCIVTSSGAIKCVGENGLGQLGNGTLASTEVPSFVIGVTGAEQISSGAVHTCATDKYSELWCWGYNGFGQMGVGSSSETPVTVAVSPTFQ